MATVQQIATTLGSSSYADSLSKLGLTPEEAAQLYAANYSVSGTPLRYSQQSLSNVLNSGFQKTAFDLGMSWDPVGTYNNLQDPTIQALFQKAGINFNDYQQKLAGQALSTLGGGLVSEAPQRLGSALGTYVQSLYDQVGNTVGGVPITTPETFSGPDTNNQPTQMNQPSPQTFSDQSGGTTTQNVPINPAEYQFKPGETIEQYNTRIAQLRGDSQASADATTAGVMARLGGGTPQAGATPTATPSLHEGTSYTVQPGDTLSAIAKRLGVPMASITGYRSGNPNLIYPGEHLQVAGTGMTGGGATAPTDPNLAQIQNIQSQIQTKQEEVQALQKYGLSDTNQLDKDANGNYVPKGQGIVPAKPPETPSDFVDVYTQALSKLGIPSIKQQFDNVQKQFSDLQNELNDKIANIHDNPWMTQGIKDRNVQQIKDRYQGKLDILTNQMKIYDSLYQEGVAQAKFLTTGEINQQQEAFNQAQSRIEAENKIREEVEQNKYKNVRELDGGLYDLASGSWVIPPKTGTIGSSSGTGGTRSAGGTGGGTGGTNTSVTLQRILSGGGSINDLTPTEKKIIQDEAYRQGLYQASPTSNFINSIQEEMKQSIPADQLKKLWNLYRAPLTNASSPSSTGSTTLNRSM